VSSRYDLDKAAECEKGRSLFTKNVVHQELGKFKARVDPKDTTPTKKPTRDQQATFVSA
jgi:hypothetical protein